MKIKIMVAYFSHDFSDNYVDLSDLCDELTYSFFLENKSLKNVFFPN